MNSRCAVAWAAALAASLAFGLVGRAAAASPPNVLLIISDDQAWTDYSFTGHPHLQTPALDQLARESLTFTRGYVTAPLCRPSLASIITGLFPHQHGITGNDPDLPDPGVNAMTGRRNPKYARYYETLMHRIEEHPTLPRLLAQHGYVSLQTGKWWEGPARRGGFTEGMTHGEPERGGRHGDAGLTIGREGLQPTYDFIERATAAQKPFFIWYAPFLPHAPHTPPERLLAKYRDKAPTIAVARYWAMCEWFDETCGELLQFLDKHNLAGNTLVVYVADNGWIQDPNQPNRFAPRSKRTPYEGGIRTPIMLRWPGHITPRMDEETPVSSIDLAPTILRACGVEPPSGLPGLNLLDPQALAARPRIFGEAYAHDVADVDHPTRSLEYRWVIEGPWKLILPEPQAKQPPTPELYNLLADPHEEHDVAGQHPERVATLRAAIWQWWAQTGGPPSPAAILFEDTFDNALAAGWRWLRETPGGWRLKDDALEIRLLPGDAQTVKNALVRPAPDRREGPFAVELTLRSLVVPTEQYEQAGITWYHDGQPVFKLVKELVDGQLMMIPGRKPMTNEMVQLRLEVDGRRYVAKYRPDGRGPWLEAERGELPPPGKDEVSIQGYHGPAAAAHWVRFDDFRILRLN